MYLNRRMTSFDHFIEGSSEFIGGSSLGYVTALISLEAINIVIVEMEGFQFLRQPKSLHEFMNESTSRGVKSLSCLVENGLLQVKTLNI